MKRNREWTAGLVIALAWANLAALQDRPQQPVPPGAPQAVRPVRDLHAPNKSHVLITISKQTTYITEPLRKDGYVNYVAALNQRFRAGVTPDNNAAVPFLKALGPGEIGPKYRDEYCRMLGIRPLPEKGDYCVALDKYAKAS